MKVQSEFAPIPRSQGKETELRYYPRVVNRHLIKTCEISAEIQHACSLTEVDVNAVLTRYDLQRACQMTKITAIRCVRRLLGDKR